MINTNLLKGKIICAGYSQRSLAKALRKSKDSINAKVNGHVPFTTDEVMQICELLSITDPLEKCAIFLP